uniref:Matrix metallopeptidase 26 n=1 Tax=Oryctolagus cuniculus TaxID=9986 RepID=G1SJV0_RABIT
MSVCIKTAIFKFTVFLPVCLAFPVPPATKFEGWDFVKDYFHPFFLMKKESPLLAYEEKTKFTQPIDQNGTGLLDEKIVTVMHQPRCGVPDGIHHSTNPGRPKWNKSSLTYSIINYPYGMRPSTVSGIIGGAISIWSSVTPLMFQQVESQDADIELSFRKRAHGDGWSFDGPGGILGHAFLPDSQSQGAVHFDKDEHWSTSNRGFNLFLVSIHEIGHSLGLPHSTNRNSIMYPTYWYQNPKKFHLSDEDIQRIQQLYGGKYSSAIP